MTTSPPKITHNDHAHYLHLYRTVLSCFRRKHPHPRVQDHTEHLLYTFHRGLAERGLPRDVDDDTEPDEFAGYSTIVLAFPAKKYSCRLGDVLPAQGLQDLLRHRHLIDKGDADPLGVEGVLAPYERLLATGGVTDILEFGLAALEAIKAYHDQPPPCSCDLPQSEFPCRLHPKKA